MIRPALVYGSETWALSKPDEAGLGVFERKILRAIFGPANDNGEWRKNTIMSCIHYIKKMT